jgi:uncharacterized protein YprB with RNaseH-like and TPR domain
MASSGDLRKRLEAMNRRPLPERKRTETDLADVRRKLAKQRRRPRATPVRAEPRSEAEHDHAAPILYPRDLPRSAPKPTARPPRAGRAVDLAQAVTGEEISCPGGGRAFFVEEHVRTLDDRAAGLCDAFGRTLADEDSPVRKWMRSRCGPDSVRPEDLLFVDLETTGLGSTPLFLIGTMTWDDGLVVRQYFARHYGEEPGVLSLFLRDAAARQLLVSFNGKSFDLPYVRVRAAANAVPFAEPPGHFDLLLVARRIWRGRLPDCRLQTLERHICGRTRFGDIPGADIPDAYHRYVRTGDAHEMVECLRHNRLDLITLADLMLRLPPPSE